MLIHRHPFHPTSDAFILLNESDMEIDETLKISTETSANASCSPPIMKGIASPHENDVLMGRGGKNNQHSGNEKLRELARERCEEYRVACKKVKSDISRELVRLMRQLDPPARFLRKDIETTKWEDVGDETAREKASQVLRDAVSEKNGPMAKSKRKSNTVSANSFPTDIAGATARKYSKENLVQVDHMQGAGNHHNFSRSAPLIRGMPPGTISSSYAHPYREYTAILGPPSVPITPRYPPVTPASESLPRKRPRAHDSPMTVHSYNYFSPHGSSFVPNASPGMGFPSPASRAFLSQGSPGYFSQSSFSGSRQLPSPSPMISEPHSSDSRLNEPWVTDIHSHYAPRRSSIAPAGDFDPYNEEILSDHSDHRDGSVSPFAYEKRDSL